MRALILLIISINISTYAKIYNEEGPIKSVTVFKDRAYVKRGMTIGLTPGAHSVQFSGITANANIDSIKVSLSNPIRAEIMGIRTETRYFELEENNEYRELKLELNKVNKEISLIREKVSTIIKEEKEIREIQKHYSESFSINLHSNNWTNRDFKKFILFLNKRNERMHVKWSKLYNEFDKKNYKLERINAKIREIQGELKSSVIDVYVDLFVRKKVRETLDLQYLVMNSGWYSTYDIRINGKSLKASIEQYGMIWQNTGEDWNDINITLSNIQSKLKTKPPQISSYVLSYQKVEKVKTKILGSLDDALSLGVGSKNNNLDLDINTLGKNFKIKEKQTVLVGMKKTKVFISKKSTDITEHFEAVPVKYPYVFRKITLKNPFLWNLNSGRAFVFYNNEFIQQTKLNHIAKGDEFYLNAGNDYNVVVNKWYSDSSEAGIVDSIAGRKTYKRDLNFSLKSYDKKTKLIRVMGQIPISEIKSVEISTKGTTSGHTKLKTFPSWSYWDIKLEPKQVQRISLKLQVNTPKDFEFRW